MATVNEPRTRRNWAENDRRVRHPLEAVRKYIRRYVALEGLGVAILYLAGMLWAGLLLDWGLFQLFAFDWIQELQTLTASNHSDFWLRIALLGVLLFGLGYVVVNKVLIRLWREFKDKAVVLLLERRFRKELGDRLITAIELADPKLAEKYGYSRELVEKTINEAADRVEKLPLASVFNWARLRSLFLKCALATFGVYLVVGVLACVIGLATGGSGSPIDFFWRYKDAATTFTERNLLLMNSYWPRQAYLEVVGFQRSKDKADVMKVGRDEQRPDLQVRAYRYVVADRGVIGGWRPLRWVDLPDFVDSKTLAAVAIPRDWHGWLVDLDDMEGFVPAGVIPPAWQGKSSGDVRAEMPNLQNRLDEARVTKSLENMLDWQTWTVDQLGYQLKIDRVRGILRQDHVDGTKALEDVLEEVDLIAQSPSMTRRLRRLDIPEQVTVYYRGKTIKNDASFPPQGDNNKYTIGLNDLTESVNFTVRGKDYYTPRKDIMLMPPPAISTLVVDKEEPAYTHYRLEGDQTPLRGKRQTFKSYPVSITGSESYIEAPIGSSIVVIAEVERELKDGVLITAPEKFMEQGAVLPEGKVVLDEKRKSFSLAIPNLVKVNEFYFDYLDEDNVKGRRHIIVKPRDDRPPELFDIEMEVVLRKPRFRQDPAKGSTGPSIDGYLITPDANIPIKGAVQDDYGLTRVDWLFEADQVTVELMGDIPNADKGKVTSLRPSTRGPYGIGAGGFMPLWSPAYWLWMNRVLESEVVVVKKSQEKIAPVDIFLQRAAAARGETRLPDLDAKLGQKLVPTEPFRKIAWKDSESFKVNKHLPQLKSSDPSREAQLHYLLKLSLGATDNNVETGPTTSRTKLPMQFLVISENELLAQVGLEEELLSERLEKVYEKLKNAKTILNDQAGKLVTLDKTDPKYEAIAIRVDESRKLVLDGTTSTREIHADYSRIKLELDVNNVNKDKRFTIETQIVLPLALLIDPRDGDFAQIDDLGQKLYENLENDTTQANRGSTAPESKRDERIKETRQLHDKVDTLMTRVYEVLIVMQQEVTNAKVLELAIAQEQRQRRIAERLEKLRVDEEGRILRELLKGLK